MFKNDLISKYFNKGYKYEDICDLMRKRHGLCLSISTLKRKLCKLGLKRKGVAESKLEDICVAIVEELHDSGYNLGYKSLWIRLKKLYGIKVKRNTAVLEMLRIADPEGVADRCAKKLKRRQYSVPGPNFIWHVDGHDKLKPYGFSISAAIDGYSRKLMWLELASTNKKPEVIVYFYLNTVQKYKFLPSIIRSDQGTENCIIEAMQTSLRFHHTDKFAGVKSFIQGKSTANQRIERYWRDLIQHTTGFWMHFFRDMRDENVFNDANPIHVECLRFCFGSLIKCQLQLTKEEWNEYAIRKQRCKNITAGRPNILYYLPEKYGAYDCKQKVTDDSLNKLMENYTALPQIYSSVFENMVKELLSDEPIPRSPEEGLILYKQIIKTIESLNE